MILAGHSSGAYLAALVCTDESYLKAEKLPLSVIKGCVAVDGRLPKELGKRKQVPPFLLLHVAEHPGESQRPCKLLQETGTSVKLHPAERKDHTSINNDLGKSGDKPTRAMFEFLATVLKD